MENHLHSCDDNGITGPDWGRSEVVFRHAVQQDHPSLRSLSADALAAYCPLQRFVYTGYSTAGGLAVSSIEYVFSLIYQDLKKQKGNYSLYKINAS